MKRQLLIAALLAAPLYLRQREVERRQRLWRAEVERIVRLCAEHQRDWTKGTNSALERYFDELNRELSRAGRP